MDQLEVLLAKLTDEGVDLRFQTAARHEEKLARNLAATDASKEEPMDVPAMATRAGPPIRDTVAEAQAEAEEEGDT